MNKRRSPNAIAMGQYVERAALRSPEKRAELAAIPCEQLVQNRAARRLINRSLARRGYSFRFSPKRPK